MMNPTTGMNELPGAAGWGSWQDDDDGSWRLPKAVPMQRKVEAASCWR